MNGGILIDWYVASQLGLQPKEMRAFLSSMEALKCPDTGTEMSTVQALDGLSYLERWVHVYVFPNACCELRRHKLARSIVEGIRHRIVAPTLYTIVDSLRSILENALDSFIAGDSSPAVLSQLAYAAEVMNNNEIKYGSNSASVADYFDIEDQDLVALVLSLILALAGEDGRAVADAFGKDSGSSGVTSFLEVLHKRALRGDQGRWCLLLAVDIGLAVPELVFPGELADSLHSVSPKSLLISPDLIWREIQMRFDVGLVSDNEDRQRVLDRLFAELLTFRHWQTLALPLLDEDGELHKLSKRQKEVVCKSLTFWQEAVWYIMAGIDVNEAAQRLQQIWLPRIFSVFKSNAGVIHLPLSQNEIDLTRSLQQLLGNQFGYLKHSPRVVAGQIDKKSAYWWSHSPWPAVVLAKNVRHPEVAYTLACASAASFGARLLLQARPSDWVLPHWQCFAMHLLFSIQEFRSYQHLVNAETRPDKGLRDVYVFVHTCRAAVEKVAGGRMPYPEPAYFTKVLEKTLNEGFSGYPIPSNSMVDTELEAIVKRKLLASALRLVEYAMAAKDDSGRKRWLSLVSRIVYMPNVEDLEEDDRLLCKLVMRFLLKNSPQQVLSEDGLRRVSDLVNEYLNTSKKPHELKHRELLLFSTDHAEMWRSLDVLEGIPDNEKNEALILTWACQRVAASMYDDSTPSELRKRWSDYLRQRLEQVFSSTPLDRFLRLRFIELLRDGLLDNDQELALAVARRLIEFGSAQDLQRLVEWVVEAQVKTEKQANIHISFFHGLLQYRRSYTESAFNSVLVRTEPDARKDFLKRLELIDRLVASCLVPNQLGQTDLATALREFARRNRDEMFHHCIASSNELERLHMDRTGKLRIDSDIGGRLDRAMAVAVDPNAEQIRILDPLNGPMNVRDLFSGSSVNPDGKSYFLGVIENFLGSGNSDAMICVDAEEKHRLKVPSNTLPDGSNAGGLLAVRCGAAGQDNTWRGTAVRDIEGLPQRKYSSSRLATVQSSGGATGSLPIRLEGLQGSPDWKLHTENFLALHSPPNGENKYKIWATEVHRGSDAYDLKPCHYEPAVLDFVDLLIDYPKAADGELLLLLCLQDIERAASGELQGIITEVLPLQRYRLRLATDLVPSAHETLVEMIETIRGTGLNAAGLFLSVQIVTTASGPLINMVDKNSPLPTVPDYPVVFSKPFDDRNIRWRKLFTENAEDDEERHDSRVLLRGQTVLKDEKTVLANLSEEMRVPGFPDQIKVLTVSPNRLPLGVAERFVEVWVESETWSPHTASAEGMFVEVNALTLSENQDDTVRELLNMQEGTHVKLMQFGRKIDINGYVLANTSENFPIWVEAESLSMLPINPINVRKSAGFIPRFARLHGINQWRRHKINPEIPLESLPAWVRNSCLTKGLLITIPRSSEHHGDNECTCEVAWQRGEEIEYGRLPVKNLEAFRSPLWQGSRVIVESVDEKTSVWFETPNFRAEALWEEVTDLRDLVDFKNNYIGSAYLQGELRNIYQKKGGQFYSESRTDTLVFMLALLDRNIDDVSSAYWRGPKFCGEATQRCVLQFDNSNDKLCGLRKQGDPSGEVRLVGVDLSISGITGGHCGVSQFVLRRRFRLQSRQQNIILKPGRESLHAIPEQDREAQRVKMMADWLIKRTPLEGEYHLATEIFHFQDRSEAKIFPDGIKVMADRATWSRRSSPYRSQVARAVVDVENPAVVSCRDAPSLPLEFLEQVLEAPRGELVRLDHDAVELYLVGVRQTTDSNGAKQQPEYLFEWGYGYWMALPASRLRFRGKPIEIGDLSLFVEDRISVVRLEENQDRLILNIEDSVPSQAHILFHQAYKHKIIHPLHVQIIKEEEKQPNALQVEDSPHTKIVKLKISQVQVEGFDPTAHADPRRKVCRGGAISGYVPQLDQNAQNVVLKRAQKKIEDSAMNWEGVIFGRLDTQAFCESQGTEIRFNYVRLARKRDEDDVGLNNGDRIFAKTDRIVEHGRNDLAVMIRPYSGLDVDDISPDIRELRVLRRAFSYRQQTLTRLYRQDPEAVTDRHVLIRIHFDGKNIYASIRDGAPLRHSVVLDTMLAVAESRVFAIYAGLCDEKVKDIRVEFRPGVIVGINQSNADISDELLVGDVVSIAAAPHECAKRYIVRRAMYSDIRYALKRRPVVVLPLQNLANPDNFPPYSKETRIKASDSFTIGDLPDLIGKLRWLVPGNLLRLPDDQQLSLFMSMGHPKLAWLQEIEYHPNERPKASITPDFTHRIRAGRLVISRQARNADNDDVGHDNVRCAHTGDRSTQELRFEPLPNANPDIRNLWTDWYLLTFRDQSVSDVVDAVSDVPWFYHDKQTIVWTAAIEKRIEKKEVLPSTMQSGPLFIEVDGRRAMLRYAQEDLPSHAVGLSNLIDVLPPSSSGNRYRCFVAGVPKEGGLYVEIVPGRIVEIPPSMTVWGQDMNDTVSLEMLDWNIFAQGDDLVIKIMPQYDSYAPERIVLDWTPSVRNAFGPAGAALRRQCFDCEAGVVVYGAGEFKVCLPSITPEKMPELALIGGSDTLIRLESDAKPPRLATVLLVRRNDGKVCCDGFDAWDVYPDKSWDWEVDTLMSSVVTRRDGGAVRIDWSKLGKILDLAGGAIPVTVENVYQPPKSSVGVLYFSRRHQDLDLSIGKIALARVIGQLPESDCIFFQVGGRQLALPGNHLVRGLPERYLPYAVDLLRRKSIPVWIKHTGECYVFGISDIELKEPLVRTKLVLAINDEEALGILCVGMKDRCLRWLPTHRAAAAPLTQSLAESAFLRNGRSFKVVTCDDGSVSILDHPRVMQELRSLRVGDRLGVEIISNENAAHAMWDAVNTNREQLKMRLVRSRASGLVMTAAVAGSDKGFMVEVAERRTEDGNTFLLLVLIGMRRIRIDFPRWIVDSLQASEQDTKQDGVFSVEDDPTLPIKSCDIAAAYCKVYQEEEAVFSLDELRRYCSAYRKAKTTSLLAGISATVLLARNVGEEDNDVLMLLRNIGCRTLRSFHLELLTSHWKENREGRQTESRALSLRIDKLLSAISSRKEKIQETMTAIDDLYDYLALNGGSDYDRAMVAALAIGLGRSMDIEKLLSHNRYFEHLEETVRAVRLLMMLPHPSKVYVKMSISRLQIIAQKMIKTGVDIPLNPVLDSV